MGLFDFLTKKKTKERPAEERAEERQPERAVNPGNIRKFTPNSFEDVQNIIDYLCSGRPAIVVLSHVRENTAQRVIDLLTGATYAINGNLSEVEKDIYIFTPDGVRIGQ